MKKKILTISMLVSGREETTEKSLLSLQPLREKLDAEIILTDTGCSQAYLEKIRGLTDKILQFTWCNDFAKARNVGLEAAESEWFMFIDDDEWFEDVTPVLEFFLSGEYKEYHQAVYKVRNYSNLEGTAYTDEWVSRMIRIEEDTHFEGAVHECLMPTRGKCKQIDAFAHHYGYAFATEEERLAHFQRNASILEDLLLKEPNNMKWPLQLVKEYLSVGDYVNMKRVSYDALSLIENLDEFFINMCRGAFYMAILQANLLVGDEEVMWQNYETFAKNDKNPWNVRCAMAAFLLLYASETEEEHLHICAQEYLQAKNSFEKEVYTEQQRIISESIVFVSEYAQKLSEYEMEVRAYLKGNGEFLFLQNRVWLLARLGVIALEDSLLELPFAQWIAQMQIMQVRGFQDVWNEIGQKLASICTRNDVRYLYFDRCIENIKMKQIYSLKENAERMDFSTMTQILLDFAQANLNYMDFLYTDAAFDGDKGLLLQEEKASLWIANGLSLDNSQWREKLKCFGEAAKVCPMLSDFVKRYMNLLGAELTK